MVFIIPYFHFLLDTGHSLAKGIMSYNPIEFWDRLLVLIILKYLRNNNKALSTYSIDKSLVLVHGFYDIVSTQISKMYNNDLIFTINLDDDPNRNKKYESTYLWLISHLDPLNDHNQVFTIIIPNFGSESNFRIKGWYLAIYDNINNKYSLPLSRIDKMTDNKVEITIDPNFIGDILDFNYTTAVMIRVNDTFLDKQPDYLIDSSPDDNTFWSKWFL